MYIHIWHISFLLVCVCVCHFIISEQAQIPRSCARKESFCKISTDFDILNDFTHPEQIVKCHEIGVPSILVYLIA